MPGRSNGTRTATVTAGVASFNDLEDNTAGTLSLKFGAGTLPPVVSSPSTVKAAPATQLVVTTAPPDPIIAGQAFVLVVAAEDQFKNVDTTYSGNVSDSLPTNPSVVVTVPVKNGVATFSGLTLPTTAQGGTIQATASGLKPVGTAPVNVTPPQGGNTPPPSPTIIGESVVMLKKTNKKGKPVGKAVFEGFKLVFSTAMNPSTAGLAGNYQVDAMTTKRDKKKTVPVYKPVTINKAVYSQSNNIDSVTLTLKSATPFAKGGRITIINTLPNGVSSAAGGLLNANDTVFTSRRKRRESHCLDPKYFCFSFRESTRAIRLLKGTTMKSDATTWFAWWKSPSFGSRRTQRKACGRLRRASFPFASCWSRESLSTITWNSTAGPHWRRLGHPPELEPGPGSLPPATTPMIHLAIRGNRPPRLEQGRSVTAWRRIANNAGPSTTGRSPRAPAAPRSAVRSMWDKERRCNVGAGGERHDRGDPDDHRRWNPDLRDRRLRLIRPHGLARNDADRRQ